MIEPGTDSRVDKVALRKSLGDQLIGNRLLYFLSLPSTNVHARELAEDGWPEGTVVMAEEQTKGKGRSEKTWHSPPGVGLYFSVLLKPEMEAGRVPVLTLLMAVAAARGLRDLGITAGIKWPNDLILDGRKIGGILADARIRPSGCHDVILGMGLNVNNTTADFPAELAARAGSIRICTGSPRDRTEILTALLKSLDACYARHVTEGDGFVIEAFSELSPMVSGARVQVDGGGEIIRGITRGLAPNGALRVDSDGDLREVHVGEVSVSGESDAPGR